MICVSVARGRHKQMLAEFHHLAEEGAELVELRLDYIRREVELGRLLRDRPCPVVVTCRREQDSGNWEGSEEARLTLLRAAIVAGAEYVDLEEDVAGDVPRYGQTKRIVSYHNFEETPENLEELHARLSKLDADIVKIATMAQTVRDNLRMLRLVRDSELPTVAFCMGDIGTPSRLLMGKYGAPFTYATFHQERTLAPGQLSYRQMSDIYDYNHISSSTEIFGVVGDPVRQSLLPMVLNACFREFDLDAVYLPFRVPFEDLDAFIEDCPELDIRGLSVAAPFKTEVCNCIRQYDSVCEASRTANTIVFDDGAPTGANTEANAAVKVLSSVFGDDAGPAPLSGKTALVLGAGGAARAIVHGLLHHGAQVVVAARNTHHAGEITERLECQVIEWDMRHTIKANIVVNATPIGMHPNVDETPFDHEQLSRGMVVFDTVYHPEQTLLVKRARENGCGVVTGVDLFVQQVALQFQIFSGLEPPYDVIRQEVLRAIRPARY